MRRPLLDTMKFDRRSDKQMKKHRRKLKDWVAEIIDALFTLEYEHLLKEDKFQKEKANLFN